MGISSSACYRRHFNSLHSLVNDGVSTRLTNDEICPLHDHNGYEESGVASVFQHLSVVVCLKQKTQISINN